MDTHEFYDRLEPNDQKQASVALLTATLAFEEAAEEVAMRFGEMPPAIQALLVREAGHEKIGAIADLLSDGDAAAHKQSRILRHIIS